MARNRPYNQTRRSVPGYRGIAKIEASYSERNYYVATYRGAQLGKYETLFRAAQAYDRAAAAAGDPKRAQRLSSDYYYRCKSCGERKPERAYDLGRADGNIAHNCATCRERYGPGEIRYF